MTDTYAALLAAGTRKMHAAAPELVGPADAHAPSPAHAAVLGAVDELLGAITANAANLPPTARMMLSVVGSARGQLIDGLTRMPEAQLVAVLRSVGERIAAVPGVL